MNKNQARHGEHLSNELHDLSISSIYWMSSPAISKSPVKNTRAKPVQLDKKKRNNSVFLTNLIIGIPRTFK
jgi:hypothetical protein